MKTEAVTLTRDLGELGQEIEVEFLVRYFPGAPETGLFGPVENYDPGSADEVNIISATATVGKFHVDLTHFYQNAMPDDLRDDLCEKCSISKDDEEANHADDLRKYALEERLAA